MAKMNRINKYRVQIDQVRDPGADIKDVMVISLDIFAQTVEEAIAKAWESVDVKQDDYEITLIESMNRPHYPERYCPDRF